MPRLQNEEMKSPTPVNPSRVRSVEAELDAADVQILRPLVCELADVAALPVHAGKAQLWARLNQLKSVRPVVWITELPWPEMNIKDELTQRCTGLWAAEIEQWLRTTLYEWRHVRADRIVSNYIPCPIVWRSTGFGISQQGEQIKGETSDITSQHFVPQIRDFADLEKIAMPIVTVDREMSEARFSTMLEAFGDIMPIRRQGIKNVWFTPWDNLVRWYGVEEALLDMIDRPDLVNAAVTRVVDACMCELDQFETLGLLDLNNDNTRIGSGGYGYTAELPGACYESDKIKPGNMWGCSNAQILSTVSSEMRWEFAVRHDLPWFKRWALTYYGCCEPLHGNMDVLRRIPNLRKVSMSPFINIDRAVREVGDGYVFSYKPNPAMMAADRFDRHRAASELRSFLERSRGCHVEIILKDISTVRSDPQRVFDWEKMTMELVDQFVR